MRRPSRSTARVRIWLIFTQERLGSRAERSSRVRGKPARCGWLVSAAAMTVPDRALNTSWLNTNTGRRPACSEPRVAPRAAHRTSPLRIGAIHRGPRSTLLLPGLSRRRGPGWRTHGRVVLARGVRASRRRPARPPCCGSGRRRLGPGDRGGGAWPRRGGWRSWAEAWDYNLSYQNPGGKGWGHLWGAWSSEHWAAGSESAAR